MKSIIEDVLVSHDCGQEVYEVVTTARDIHQMYKHGLLVIDPSRQRGINTVSNKEVVKKEKVDRWTSALIKDEAVFGQLSWNFRPDESKTYYDPDKKQFVIEHGTATLPDSAHRHRAIFQAVESVAKGSSFDLNMKFSVRIWRVPADMENDIFYFMNQEGDKADATRSKWLAQKNSGQKIAATVVRRSKHMTEANVETVSNTLSAKNPRLTAFNTMSVAFETSWSDIAEDKIESVADWFCDWWEHLVEVRPELGKLSLAERQKVRKESIVASALAIHGLIALARRFYDDHAGFEQLAPLADPVDIDGKQVDLFSVQNPQWLELGILVPSTAKGGTSLTVRNALQTRRVMADTLAAKLGLLPQKLVENAA